VTQLAHVPFPELFAERAPAMPGGGKTLSARKAALDEFLERGLPTARDEDWKYTNLSALAASGFELATPGPALSEAVLGAHALPGVQRMVFVNGHFAAALSSDSFTQGMTVRPLASELDRGVVQLGMPTTGRSLNALNAAFAQDGAVIRVDAKAQTQTSPLHLIFVSSAARPTMAHPRSLIWVGAGASATVWVSHVSHGEERSFHNGVMEVRLEEEAQLTLNVLQDASSTAFNLEWLDVQQARASRFTSHLVAVGGTLGRHEIEVSFNGEGAECDLTGLFIGRERQHLDQRTFVRHSVPRCSSNQVYKGVLDGSSHGVFNGKLYVAVDAQKTNAQQSNKNLVLSEGAQVDTRPQLEIFADDVKCAHGAAIGQLDEDAMFYLRSRGIAEADAKGLLTYAFASELVEKLTDTRWKTLVQTRLRHALSALLPEAS